MAEPGYAVVSPEPAIFDLPLTFTEGISDLSGKTVCHLWDGLFRGDELFAIIADALRQRFPGVNIIDHTAFGTTHGPDEAEVLRALPAKIKKLNAHVAISGLGA